MTKQRSENAMEKLDFNAAFSFREFESWAQDEELTSRLRACIEVQKQREPELLKTRFQPNPHASEEVSAEQLQSVLRTGKGVNRGLERNCFQFGFTDVESPIRDRKIRRLMHRVDRLVSAKVRDLFRSDQPIWADRTGHLWYPPGSYMCWHTNSGMPGWRMYMTYCDEPGKSFFRYRDPKSQEVVTSYDKKWTVRLFKVSAENPLWHAVYSDTNRYSFGYRIVHRPALSGRILDKLGRVWRDIQQGRLPRYREV